MTPSSSSSSTNKENSQEQSHITAAQKRRQYLLALHTDALDSHPTLGDILLPFLFAAMETCWLDAIFIGLASTGLFQSHEPLMPLWAPFVLIIGSQWILSLLERRAIATSTEIAASKAPMPGSSLFILFVSTVTLFVVWVTLYTSPAFFLDPRWLFSLLNDILLLDVQAYHVFFIIAIILYLCWRSMRLLHHEYEPSQVFNALRLGMSVIVVVILLRAGQIHANDVINDDVMLMLFVPIFLFLSLAAHSLARISFMSHTHPMGSEDDIVTNERAILFMIGMIGLILLLTAWLVDTFASPTILGETQQLFGLLSLAYDQLVNILAVMLIFLVTPLFWLITWWTSRFPAQLPSSTFNRPRPHPVKPVHPSSVAIAMLIPVLKILFPLLLVVVAFLLIRWLRRHRKRVRMVSRRRIEELHESLWSWALFWTQFKTLLRALFGRFLPRHTAAEEQIVIEAVSDETTVRTIREVYRALLKRASTSGYPRKKNETPYEFEQRLNENTPLAQPQLAVVTEAYIATRYGGYIPDESEVILIQQEWTVLDQKWRAGQAKS
ncbi:MAG: hypothetical protein NVSMB33_08990 [Ktedonobacteraceae bacterium]